ncbi:MAG TPA: hypothetical protein DDW65_03320 [Firmicutes bacterium]|jgi:AcrR family transcriptional regulator|nr:hypothetical protein [Bacillota bacterium]
MSISKSKEFFMAISTEKSNLIREQRRKQILDVALEMFDEKGFTNTRVSDIAEIIGISKGLVYRYYKTKLDILKEYKIPMQTCLDDILERPTAMESLRDFGSKLITDPKEQGYLPPMRVFIAIFIRGELPPDMNENFIHNDFGKNYLAPIIKKGQENGEFRQGDPVELANIYWYYLLGIMTHILHDKNTKVERPNLDTILNILKGA